MKTALIKGVTKTSEDGEVTLKDPNLNPEYLPTNYAAKTTVKRKIVEVIGYTSQTYSEVDFFCKELKSPVCFH